jgi:transposase
VRLLYERCAAIDVHKDQVTVAVRTPGDGPGGRQTQVRKFRAFYGVLTEMARWLVSLQVSHVGMEATGIYTMPVYHALIEQGRFEQVLVCNAAHVKNVPGRKTDAVDAVWLAELLECGLLRGSFIPEPEIKAVRDITRYRKKVVGACTSELQRLGSVLQDAGIKLDSVASSIAIVSGRAMIEALIDGERRPAVLAELARGRMRAKIPDLTLALGRPFRCPPRPDVPATPGTHRPPRGHDRPLGCAGGADDDPFCPAPGSADHDPGHRTDRGGRDLVRDRYQPG